MSAVLFSVLTCATHGNGHINVDRQFTIMIPVDIVLVFECIALEGQYVNDAESDHSDDSDDRN